MPSSLTEIVTLRRGIKADAAAEAPRITHREIAAEMGRQKGREPYNAKYLGRALDGEDEQKPHIEDYLLLARAALDALIARRQAAETANTL